MSIDCNTIVRKCFVKYLPISIIIHELVFGIVMYNYDLRMNLINPIFYVYNVTFITIFPNFSLLYRTEFMLYYLFSLPTI